MDGAAQGEAALRLSCVTVAFALLTSGLAGGAYADDLDRLLWAEPGDGAMDVPCNPWVLVLSPVTASPIRATPADSEFFASLAGPEGDIPLVATADRVTPLGRFQYFKPTRELQKLTRYHILVRRGPRADVRPGDIWLLARLRQAYERLAELPKETMDRYKDIVWWDMFWTNFCGPPRYVSSPPTVTRAAAGWEYQLDGRAGSPCSPRALCRFRLDAAAFDQGQRVSLYTVHGLGPGPLATWDEGNASVRRLPVDGVFESPFKPARCEPPHFVRGGTVWIRALGPSGQIVPVPAKLDTEFAELPWQARCVSRLEIVQRELIRDDPNKWRGAVGWALSLPNDAWRPLDPGYLDLVAGTQKTYYALEGRLETILKSLVEVRRYKTPSPPLEVTHGWKRRDQCGNHWLDRRVAESGLQVVATIESSFGLEHVPEAFKSAVDDCVTFARSANSEGGRAD